MTLAAARGWTRRYADAHTGSIRTTGRIRVVEPTWSRQRVDKWHHELPADILATDPVHADLLGLTRVSNPRVDHPVTGVRRVPGIDEVVGRGAGLANATAYGAARTSASGPALPYENWRDFRMACVIERGEVADLSFVSRLILMGAWISNLALRRRAAYGADEQVVQGCPLRGAQGAEEIVLEETEPAVGHAELVLTAG
jgi:hypothetical protein